MDWLSARKIMGQLKPGELFEILTRGHFEDLWKKIESEILSISGQWYLENWGRNDYGSPDIKIDVLTLYMTDHNLLFYVTSEEAVRMKSEMESWGVFEKVSVWWFNDFVDTLSIGYSPDMFHRLYLEWKREKTFRDLDL